MFDGTSDGMFDRISRRRLRAPDALGLRGFGKLASAYSPDMRIENVTQILRHKPFAYRTGSNFGGAFRDLCQSFACNQSRKKSFVVAGKRPARIAKRIAFPGPKFSGDPGTISVNAPQECPRRGRSK